MHLTDEQLIDLAEGTRPESAEPHLAACERCRAQVAELRAVMALAAGVEVPEPSPLFWDHLSARVRDGVANEAAGSDRAAGRRWLSGVWGWRLVVPAAALAALILAAAIALRAPGDAGLDDSMQAEATAVAGVDGADMAGLFDNDPSLSLLADLAGELDWDDAVEAGLTTGAASVDRVVREMSADEREELQRILTEELARHGV